MSSASPIVNVGAKPLIVPVVTPPSADLNQSGRIRNIAVRGVDNSGWLQPDGEGGWALTKAKERQGYLLLEDYYRNENNLEGWGTYRRYLKDFQAGRTTKSFPIDLLPKAVLDAQRGVVGDRYADPWNRPQPAPTTGATTDGPAALLHRELVFRNVEQEMEAKTVEMEAVAATLREREAALARMEADLRAREEAARQRDVDAHGKDKKAGKA